MPLLLLAPGVTALTAAANGSKVSVAFLIATVSACVGLFTIVGLSSSISYLNCRGIGSPLEVAWRTLPVALSAGGTFAGATAASLASLDSHSRPVTLAAGAAIAFAGCAITLVLYLNAVPSLSCAAPG
jgi:hypothetical protein